VILHVIPDTQPTVGKINKIKFVSKINS